MSSNLNPTTGSAPPPAPGGGSSNPSPASVPAAKPVPPPMQTFTKGNSGAGGSIGGERR